MTVMSAGSGIGARVALLVTGLLLALAFAAAAPGAAQARCKGSDKAPGKISKQTMRKAVRCVINKERSARDLDLRGDLNRAAQSHTNYMRKSNCFSHQCPGEAPLGTRVGRTGYRDGARSYTYAEVLAKLSQKATARDAVRAWMNSSGHRGLILSGSYKHIGVGISAKKGTALYTAVLGSRS